MTLNVSKLSNNNIYTNNPAGKRTVGMPENNVARKNEIQVGKVKKSNDGKFSFAEAMKNFGKGLVSPLTSMFQSSKSFLIGSATILGSVALVVATGGAAAPLLVAAGVGMGVIQAGKAAYNIAKAKNGDDIEKAFFDIGGATGALGLSLFGAKASLRQAGMETEGMNAFNGVAKCFKNAKTFVGESVETFKSGYFKTHLYNAVKPYIYTSRIRKLSKQFYNEGKSTFNQNFDEIRSVLPEDFQGDLQGRPKGITSIFDKLIDRGTFNKKIKKIQNNTKLTDIQKAEEISTLKANKQTFKTNEAYAKKLVDDLVGTRLVVKDPIPQNIDKIANALEKAIQENKIVITEIKNYRGPGNEKGFYFDEKQIDKILDAAEAKGIKIKLLEGKNKIKDSGYCAAQIKIKHKSGAWGELQVRGQKVDEIACWEHIAYDLRKGKDLTKGNRELDTLLHPFKVAAKKLTNEEYKQYEAYVAKLYTHARDAEMGIKYSEPVLPNGFDPILSAKSLRKLFSQTKDIQIIEEKHFSTLPELAVAYSVTPEVRTN